MPFLAISNFYRHEGEDKIYRIFGGVRRALDGWSVIGYSVSQHFHTDLQIFVLGEIGSRSEWGLMVFEKPNTSLRYL